MNTAKKYLLLILSAKGKSLEKQVLLCVGLHAVNVINARFNFINASNSASALYSEKHSLA